MKIVIVDPHYTAFLNDFYAKNPKAKNKSYAEQLEMIFARCFGTADFYSKHLKELGWDAADIIPNCEPLQKAWAKEHGVRYKKNYFARIPKLRKLMKTDWEEKILEAQLRFYKPDIIYCQAIGVPSQKLIEKSGIQPKLLVGQIASPLEFNKEKIGYYDLILTSLPHFVDRLKAIGIASEYFKIGFEESILPKLVKTPETHKAVFVGGISPHHNGAIETFEYLIEKNIPIDFWGYGINKLGPASPIAAHHHGPAWGIDMLNIVYNSKISVNRHIDVAENYANNMRLFESTGVGTMLITDHKDNIGELFEIGKEIETYKTKQELAEKITYYLAHEAERKKIAEAGQKRTLRDHTYKKRMEELSIILKKYL